MFLEFDSNMRRRHNGRADRSMKSDRHAWDDAWNNRESTSGSDSNALRLLDVFSMRNKNNEIAFILHMDTCIKNFYYYV